MDRRLLYIVIILISGGFTLNFIMNVKKNLICFILIVTFSFSFFYNIPTYAHENTYASSSVGGTVTQAVISLNKSAVAMERGKKTKIKATISNSNETKIIWKSSRKKVAVVNNKGIVKAKKKGKTIITATIKGTNIQAACEVVVKKYITMKVKTTGYCNCSRCAGKWAGSPTAMGTRPKQGRTIAVDRSLIQLGTKVEIGDNMYVAEDTGGAVKGKIIDIYYSSHSRALAHGVKYQKARVYI